MGAVSFGRGGVGKVVVSRHWGLRLSKGRHSPMRKLLLLFVTLVMVAVAMPPADAITRGGELDGEDHPYVGLSVAWSGDDALGRCSGSLVSPTVFVTAGHCTFGADRIEIWFATDVDAGIPANGYPSAGEATGTPVTHPLYVDSAFFLYDLGVVILDEPVEMDRYAQLPTAGAVDQLGKGRKNSVVTAVGYGLQQIISNPQNTIKIQADRVRYQADLMIVTTNGVAGIGSIEGSNSMAVSGDAKHGGTCFGDSGGPFLIEGDTLVAVNSFGLNGNCAGIGGAFRIDRQLELDFINAAIDGSLLGEG